jgi:hypothetical protein
MKKLLVTLAAVLISASAFAQGTVVFNNRNLTGAGGTLYHAPITGNTVGATAQLFLVGTGGALTPLTPTQTFRPAPNNAFFVGPVTVEVPNVAAGTSGTIVRVRAWQGASWDAATERGESTDITLGPLGGTPPGGLPPVTPPDLGGLNGANGLQSFAIVPEPSTIALGVLGAAALLLRRRK